MDPRHLDRIRSIDDEIRDVQRAYIRASQGLDAAQLRQVEKEAEEKLRALSAQRDYLTRAKPL